MSLVNINAGAAVISPRIIAFVWTSWKDETAMNCAKFSVGYFHFRLVLFIHLLIEVLYAKNSGRFFE